MVGFNFNTSVYVAYIFFKCCDLLISLFKFHSFITTMFKSLSIFSLYRLVRLTSPNLNYLIGSGAILLYLAIIVTVLPAKSAVFAGVLCNLRVWLTGFGYSLCYGTILVKMWRVYYIFSNPFAQRIMVHKMNNNYYYYFVEILLSSNYKTVFASTTTKCNIAITISILALICAHCDDPCSNYMTVLTSTISNSDHSIIIIIINSCTDLCLLQEPRDWILALMVVFLIMLDLVLLVVFSVVEWEREDLDAFRVLDQEHAATLEGVSETRLPLAIDFEYSL